MREGEKVQWTFGNEPSLESLLSKQKFGVKQSSGLLQGDFLHQTCLIE
jgi:hypothetical protein